MRTFSVIGRPLYNWATPAVSRASFHPPNRLQIVDADTRPESVSNIRFDNDPPEKAALTRWISVKRASSVCSSRKSSSKRPIDPDYRMDRATLTTSGPTPMLVNGEVERRRTIQHRLKTKSSELVKFKRLAMQVVSVQKDQTFDLREKPKTTTKRTRTKATRKLK